MCKGIHLARERMIAVNTFKWMSHEQMYVDEIHVEKCGPLSVGVYGGNQESDAYERGDAVLAWWDPELHFEFVMYFHFKLQNFKTNHNTKTQNCTICTTRFCAICKIYMLVCYT